MEAVFTRWPHVVVQLEDFATDKAIPLLEKYRTKYRYFNDDIQVVLYLLGGQAPATPSCAQHPLPRPRLEPKIPPLLPSCAQRPLTSLRLSPNHPPFLPFRPCPLFPALPQGTGCITLAGFIAAARQPGKPLTEMRFVCAGAGAAGLGVCSQIAAGMVQDGMSKEEAMKRIVICTSEVRAYQTLNEGDELGGGWGTSSNGAGLDKDEVMHRFVRRTSPASTLSEECCGRKAP
jgi:hypothetical protein